MFGKWRVLSSRVLRRGNYRYVHVKCKHRKEWISYDNLRAGKSIGCRSCREHEDSINIRRLSGVWNAMKSRCLNKRDPAYASYGKRGINISQEFLDRNTFISWAIRAGYKEGLTLDRVDNNGPYSSTNCQWVTQAKQNRNKRNNIYVIWNNIKLCFTDFAKQYTYLSSTYARRLYQEGRTLEEITKIKPAARGRRAQSLRLGKLRPQESIYGRKFNRT